MRHDGDVWIAPFVLLAVALVVDAWVYVDARSRSAHDDAVVASVGPVTLSTPEHWLIGCVLLWILVLPLYLVARQA